MNLQELHEWTGQLIAAGVDKTMPITSLVNGHPCEVSDAVLANGNFKGDPTPQMIAYKFKTGNILILVPISEDQSELFNSPENGIAPSHIEHSLPIDYPYPD